MKNFCILFNSAKGKSFSCASDSEEGKKSNDDEEKKNVELKMQKDDEVSWKANEKVFNSIKKKICRCKLRRHEKLLSLISSIKCLIKAFCALKAVKHWQHKQSKFVMVFFYETYANGIWKFFRVEIIAFNGDYLAIDSLKFKMSFQDSREKLFIKLF